MKFVTIISIIAITTLFIQTACFLNNNKSTVNFIYQFNSILKYFSVILNVHGNAMILIALQFAIQSVNLLNVTPHALNQKMQYVT